VKAPPRIARALALTSLVAALGASLTACGSSASTAAGGGQDAGGRAPRLAAPLHPAASCPVTIDSPELLASPHIPEGAPTSYNSNPPTSGPHYPVWANFTEFSVPFDEGYLVHSLEHGAVALLYKCDGAACAPILEGLRKLRDAAPNDPLCDPALRVRIIIAPDPRLDVPVAAAAWGWTYKADCLDAPTLQKFVSDHYAQGSENLCAPGRAF
jgi:hypothetical protein